MNDLLSAIVIAYVLCNSAAFLSFALDKRSAERNRWRLSERFLLFTAFFGPFGAYAAMKIFRHKTRTFRFYLVPVFMFLHILIIAALSARVYPVAW